MMAQEETRANMLVGDCFREQWPHISEAMDRVPHIWNRFWTKEALCYAVEDGRVQCWGAGWSKELKVICFTQVVIICKRRVLQCLFTFGNEIEKALPILAATLQRFAQLQDCDEFFMIGRAGWKKLLAPYGVQTGGTEYFCRIEKKGLH